MPSLVHLAGDEGLAASPSIRSASMDRWYTSDLHFGHARVLEHRRFASLDDMHEILVTLWNEAVHPRDEVWILGDLALPPYEDSLPVASRTHGRKVLVPGNHAECWAGKGHLLWKAIGRQSLYTYLGDIAAIVDSPMPHQIAGESVHLSHFPFSADHTGRVRYPEWRPRDNGQWLLHGHLHAMWRQHDREINVGVDAWSMRPVHVDQIADMITAGPQDLAPLGAAVCSGVPGDLEGARHADRIR